jgi:hypothetical protein
VVLPKVASTGGDSQTPPIGDRAALATRIRDSRQVSLLTFHVSNKSDPPSTAHQNIVDTANGLPAKTSSFSHVGRTNVSLDVRMLQAMVKLAETYSYRVTAIAGSYHSKGSPHYAGLAFDVDLINGVGFKSRTATVSAFMQACRDLSATKGHPTHIHAEWPR